MITIREIEIKDVDLIIDYWHLSDDDYLVGLGVDLNKVPSKNNLRQMLNQQIALPLNQKQSYALIWEYNGQAIGHSNVTEIKFAESAKMHLHIWNSDERKKGVGTELLKKSIALFFKKLKLKMLICEPLASNPAPNKILKKVGFKLEKKYITIPGSLNFEQEVNRWVLLR